MVKKKSKLIKALFFLIAIVLVSSIVINYLLIYYKTYQDNRSFSYILTQIGSGLLAVLILFALFRKGRLEKVKELIDKDIEEQRKLLTGDFQKDILVGSRIIGMEKLKEDINKL